MSNELSYEARLIARLKLPRDVSRCSAHNCPKREECLRYTDVKVPVVYTWSMFTVKNCKFFIGENDE